MPAPRPSSAMLSDFCKSDYDESTSLMRNIRSEAHTPDSPHSVCTDNELMYNEGIQNSLASPMIFHDNRKSRARKMTINNGDILSKRNSMSCRSLERLNRGPGRVSVWSDKSQIQVPHPFRGAQNSQMICSSCGYKVLNFFIYIFIFYTRQSICRVSCGMINLTALHCRYLKVQCMPSVLDIY